MSSINATYDPVNGALVFTGDNTASLALQTNGKNAIIFDSSQNANCASTSAIKVPSGTTGQQPTAINGMVRYNTTNNTLEAYLGGAWINFP